MKLFFKICGYAVLTTTSILISKINQKPIYIDPIINPIVQVRYKMGRENKFLQNINDNINYCQVIEPLSINQYV